MQVAGCRFLGFRFEVTGFGFQVSGCSCRFRVSGFRFQVSDFRFPVTANGINSVRTGGASCTLQSNE